MRTEPWVDRFRRALEALCPVGKFRCALVGVSGGPDSVALLRLLVELRDSSATFPKLFAAHVHHGIRGAEADSDAEFVEALARRLGVECLVARADATAERRALKLSPEAAARSVRYRQFRVWAEGLDADLLFLGHNLEDQAETVLLRAVRGSGIAGLGGMAPVRALERAGGKTLLLRPLLSFSRAEILEYLKAAGESYRIDSTNRDLSVPRNRLRWEVLPTLESKVQAGAIRSLAGLAEIAAAVTRDLRILGRRAFAEARAAAGGESGALSAQALRTWPANVVREALKIAVEEAVREALGRTEEVTVPESACRALLEWLRREAPLAAAFEFGRPKLAGPGARRSGIRLELRYGLVRISVAGRGELEIPAERVLGENEPVRWLDWEIQAIAEPYVPARGEGEGPRGDSCFEERVDADSVAASGALKVRSAKPGDGFWPLGGPGRKPLGEFFRERCVWPSERPRVPLVVAGETIVWVVGHRIDHRFRLRPETVRKLLLRARRARP